MFVWLVLGPFRHRVTDQTLLFASGAAPFTQHPTEKKTEVTKILPTTDENGLGGRQLEKRGWVNERPPSTDVVDIGAHPPRMDFV